MPRREDIHRILILGSGPIVIGQAAEFDYSGVQACKVLREEGYEVVLMNSNPATIMTDPELADATYIEPLLPGPMAPLPLLVFPHPPLQREAVTTDAIAKAEKICRSTRTIPDLLTRPS